MVTLHCIYKGFMIYRWSKKDIMYSVVTYSINDYDKRYTRLRLAKEAIERIDQ